MKKLIALFPVLLAVPALSQDASAAAADPFGHPQFALFVVMAFVFIVLILVIGTCFVVLRALNTFIELNAREKAAALGVVYQPAPTFWKKISDKFNRSVPVEREQDIDMGHSYDGIRELDNHLPPWWKWLFYGTIAWSVFYIFAFHLSDTLPLSEQEYENEVAAAEEARRIYQSRQPQAVINIETLEFSADPPLLENGKKVFLDNNCGSCHRNDGGGNAIGPNLTDEYWIHGGDVKKVFSTVRDGVLEKGMPSWGKALSPTDVRDVTFYILSLQGSNPPDAKAAQGELYKQSSPIKADSVKIQASL